MENSKIYKMDIDKIKRGVELILEGCGIKLEGELKRTPMRVAKLYTEIFSGLLEDPLRHIRILEKNEHDEMVVLRDIPFYSICEHHLLPFVGSAAVVYIPREGKIVGISKIVRLICGFARRPQVQERLTSQIADALYQTLNPLGVMVLLKAEHMCMIIRGVKKAGTKMITSAIRGIFHEDLAAREEALSFLK